MNKFLVLLLLGALTLGLGSSVFAQEEHGGHAAEGAQAGHGETPLQTVFKWVNFAVLFGGLAFLLRQPMREFFTSRRQEIGSGLQRAQDSQAAARARMDEIEQRLAALSAEIAALRSEAQQESKADREKILAEARREVDRVIEHSRQEIDRAARAVERQIKEDIADLVIDRAGKALRSEMTQDDQKRVVLRFIKKL